MKTCPINKVVDVDGALLTRLASWLGVNAMWLKPLMVPIATFMDDWLANGKRNPVKKWWLDHELVNGIAVAPKGTNQRDIDPTRRVNPAHQKMAVYHASMMPAPNEPGPVEVDRKAAMAAVSQIETPDQARKRIDAGTPAPAHYVPTPPVNTTIDKQASIANPYK